MNRVSPYQPHYYCDNCDPDASDQLLYFYAIQYGLHVLMFFLNCIVDVKPKKYDERIRVLKNPCPKLEAAYFSRLFYFWCDSLLWLGFRKPLVTTDLWDMDPVVTSRGVVPMFDKYLNPAMEKSKIKALHHTPVSRMSTMGSARGSLNLTPEKKLKGSFSVLPAMIKTFLPGFALGSLMKIVCDGLAQASPQLMSLMIGFVTSHALGIDSEPTWKGYFYAATLLCSTMTNTVMLSQYFERMFVIGMNLRTTLISAIYRKALRMSGSARKESTVGEIVNLMSVDVQRFMDLLPYLNMLWSSPLQMVLCSYFIGQEMGVVPTVVGVSIMIIAIPLNGVAAGFSRRYQLAQMKNKDQRVKLMNEILSGVKVLKLYGWEPSFIKQILDIRDNEITVLKKAAWLNAIVSFIWTSVPFIVTLATFATYVLIDENNVLDAQKAFVTLSYMNILRMPLIVLPYMIITLVQANVSLSRINKYMNNEELDTKAVEHEVNKESPITVENGTFRWGADEPTALENININIKQGSLTAVVGTVGSGKSSLVSAMLGELEKRSGRVNVIGSIAYVPQQAWMQNATVKENVLFGKIQNNKQYEKVIDACALRSDLKILPGGDSTEIGEKGINLSGGQKQRVSLARAVYSDADLYLLDDPLSAVDSHVGKHIFDHVISHNGLLAKKTRVLVTHGITYLPKTDHIIVMKDGKVSEQGSYDELLGQKGEFANFLLEYMTEMDDNPDDIDDIKAELEETLGKNEFERQVSQLSQRKESVVKQLEPPSKFEMETSFGENRERLTSKSESIKEENEKDSSASQTGTNVKKDEQKAGTTLIDKESMETGSVSFKVYLYYMKYLGIFGVVLGIAMQTFYQGCSIGTNYWLNWWSNDTFHDFCKTDKNCRDFYLGVYGAFGFGQAIGVMTLSITIAITTLNASMQMHKVCLERVLKGPMEFFDTTPLGRIVNRFAKDVDVCDNTLPQNLRSWLSTFANFIGTIVVIISVVPWFGIAIVPIAIIFYFVQTIYVNTARQLKRLESVSRSPIYSHFGETLSGASTIRAFGLQNKFTLQSEALVDKNQICYFPTIMANRWLAVRLETIGNFITFAAALFVIIDANVVEPSEVGLVISYAINITQTLNFMVRMTADVETNIVAVERIKEYSEIKNEANWKSNNSPPANWPDCGGVEFKGYGMRYRDGLDLVIKNINANIKGGEKVGIVGRTGAGKSSLTVALFRLVEPAQGTICIDGLDIAEMGLHELRTKLTIIPQDPVLFSGTLRINLDPFYQHNDDELWKALELAHLKEYANSLESGLQHEVAEGGENLSVGQRQLICLARALLRKTKILILDEATAAVDLETDDLIQATIRKEFKECTVLTIAHRLNTILDYDRIMVLDKGEIAEFQSPNTLIEDESSIFHSMAKDAGLA